MNYSLLDGATATGDGPTLSLRSDRSRDEALVQVAITGGTATVVIYGRLSEAMPWVELTSTTADAIVPLARVAEMKANVSAISGATVDAVVFYDV